VYDFLLLINSNLDPILHHLDPILHHFWDMATYLAAHNSS